MHAARQPNFETICCILCYLKVAPDHGECNYTRPLLLCLCPSFSDVDRTSCRSLSETGFR